MLKTILGRSIIGLGVMITMSCGSDRDLPPPPDQVSCVCAWEITDKFADGSCNLRRISCSDTCSEDDILEAMDVVLIRHCSG